jgi:Cft2 family RNA processing exonuclease
MDYTQIESTYADRNHPNKQEEFEKLIHEINSTE